MDDRLVAILGVCLAACATVGISCADDRGARESTALPSYLVDPQANPHPACPPASSIMALGSSSAGLEEAGARARAAVVRHISSDIEVETTRIVETSQKDGHVSLGKQLQERIRDRARFGYGQLIRIVGSPGDRGRETVVLACLDRGEAARAVMADLGPKLAHFREVTNDAMGQHDRSAFSVAFAEAMRAAPEIFSLLPLYRTLAGADGQDATDFMGRLQELDEAAVHIRGQVLLRLALDGQGLPAELGERVVEAIRSAIVRAGIRAELGESCPEKSEATVLLHVKAVPACRWGSMGYACESHVSATALDCESRQTVFDGALGAGALKGIDSADEARALRRSLEKVSPALFEPDLERMLASQIPLEGSL